MLVAEVCDVGAGRLEEAQQREHRDEREVARLK